MEKKYQVFISSTYTDLVEKRKKVQDTILSMYHFPIGMELFSAADEEQWEIIKETIDSSDYYVLIIAHRYGSVIEDGPDAGISYTEKEYRYAKERGIPILAFIIDSSVKVSPDDVEVKHRKELDAFIQDVKTGRIVQWWKSSDDLATQIMNALYKQFAKGMRPGWVRADEFNIEESHAELLALNKKVRELEDENGQLRDELQAYKQQNSERAPKLTVTINVDTIDDELGNECHPEYALQDEDTFLEGVKVLNVPTESIDEHFKKISIDDFLDGVKRFARQEEIEEYNKSLPGAEELSAYKTSVEDYVQAKRSCVHINIGIHNDGNSKASNASATIEFPDGVMVYDEEIMDMEEPKSPKLAKNPITTAKKRMENQRSIALNINTDAFAGIKIPDEFLNGGLIRSIRLPKDFSLYDNTVEIDCGTIIHTKNYWHRGIFLVGKKPGKYQIKCTLMCEEYREPQTELIDFIVEG